MNDVEKGMTTSRSRTPKRRTVASEVSEGLEVVGKSHQAPAEIDQDLHIPLTSRAVFWQPRHLALSDAMLHVPYLFWLLETCRPANVVQIGTGDGVAFLALCQAIDKLSLSTPCLGLHPDVDTPALPEVMAAQHQSHYEDFSVVVSDDPAAAVRHVRDRNIDLLILNTTLTDERVMALRAHWQSRLSERAVVVVLNPDQQASSLVAREFIDAIARACPGIRLQHGKSDIETYLVGQDQPDRLKKLAALETGAPGYLAARQVFSRLGQGLYQGQLARAAQADAEQAKIAATETREQLLQREEEVEVQRRQAEQARQAETEQATVASDLQARLFDTEAALETLRAELDESQKKRQAFYARSKELEAQISALDEARQAEQSALRDEFAQAEARGDSLRGSIEQLEAQIAVLEGARQAEQSALRDELVQAEARAETLRSGIEHLEAQIAALEGARQTEQNTHRDELAQAEARAESLRSSIGQLEAQIATLKDTRRAEQDAHRDALAQAEAHAEALNSSIGQLEAQIAALEGARQAEQDALRDELVQASERAGTLAAGIEALEAQKAELTATLEERMADIVALSEGFEKRLAETTERHTAELAGLHAKLDESEIKRKEFFAEKSTLAERTKTLEAELERRALDLAKITDDYEKRLSEKESEREELAGKFAKAEEKQQEYGDAKRNLQETLRSLEAQHKAELESRIDDIATLTSDFQNRLTEKEAERLEFAAKLAESDEKRREFLEAKRELQEELKLLQQQHMQELQESLANAQAQHAQELQEALANAQAHYTQELREAQITLHEQHASQLAERDIALAKQTEKLEAALTSQSEMQETALRHMSEIQVLTQQIGEHETKRREFLQAKRGLQETLATLQEQHASQLAERDIALAKQADKLEKAMSLQSQTQETASRLSSEIEMLTQKLTESEQAQQNLQGERDALLNSTSWRVTKPMRKAKLLISG